DFLTTYMGPILMAPLFWLVLRKIIRICKAQRITSIADFISARYGKSLFLGAFATIICILAIIPYISIQLKAISSSFRIFSADVTGSKGLFFNDSAFYLMVILAVFTIFFGSRKIDTSQKNTGLITVVAFESLFKLFAFVVLGFYVTYGLFNGFSDIFIQSSELPYFERLITLDPLDGYGDWFWLNILSFLAIILLPRQFHVAVKENNDENHLKKAIWLFPLYLFLINVFVLPIALGGNLLFPGNSVDADTYVLVMPLAQGNTFLALLVFLGGFSAATSMIIVSTSALSIMISNNLMIPGILRSEFLSKKLNPQLNKVVLRGRQLMIVVMLMLAYLYYKYIGQPFPLVSIGLISFVGVAQFAPSAIGGMFWKGGNYKGAIASLTVGFLVWMFTLVLPTIVNAKLIDATILNEGLFGLSWLKPQAFLGVDF
ncbi:MAG: histidine kinase, partial [Bacteroidota bacterium]